MAQVILLEKIHSLGEMGKQVTVANGYARNYLIPYGKAVIATPQTIAEFESRRAELEKIAQEKLAAAQARGEKLAALTLTLAVKAADEGRLYGSVGVSEVVQAVQAAGCELEKSEVCLPHGPIRQLGEHEIALQLHSDVTVQLKLNLVPEA